MCLTLDQFRHQRSIQLWLAKSESDTSPGVCEGWCKLHQDWSESEEIVATLFSTVTGRGANESQWARDKILHERHMIKMIKNISTLQNSTNERQNHRVVNSLGSGTRLYRFKNLTPPFVNCVSLGKLLNLVGL